MNDLVNCLIWIGKTILNKWILIKGEKRNQNVDKLMQIDKSIGIKIRFCADW